VVIIHIYMEIHKETLCVATFITNKQKDIFKFFSFFFFLLQIQIIEGQNRSYLWGFLPVKGEVAGKGGRRVNTVQKLCTPECKCKNDTC
jgi:hypothetical protein